MTSPSTRRFLIESARGRWTLSDGDDRPVASAGLQGELLAIARRLLREHGGQIELRARDRGTSRMVEIAPVTGDERASVRPRRGDPWR